LEGSGESAQMVEILTLGSISSVALKYIKKCIDDASRAFDLDVRALRVVVAESRERLGEFLDASLGGAGLAPQPLSSASHLYVAGRPTVMVVASELYDKGEAVVWGEMLIALAHAKLHGSEEYYAIRVLPPTLQRIVECGALKDFVMAVLYLVASGVKGYEATKFVVERGYLSEMEGLFKFHLRITPEERASWIMAKGNPRAQALLALNAFKILANALPVYSSSTDGELRGLFEENLDVMPPELRSDVKRALFDVLPREPQKTFERIEACLEALREIVCTALL